MSKPSNIIETARKTVNMSNFKIGAKERLLDIGGGGEGILSHLCKGNVVAIDVRPDELDEVNEGDSLKLVMDASKMMFRDNQFDHVTSFFSLMYMEQGDLDQVMKEVHRVLKPKGKFHLWETDLPSINAVEEDIFVLQLSVQMPDRAISTGYGVGLKKEGQNLEGVRGLLENEGFLVLESAYIEEGIFYVRAVNSKE